VDRLPRLLLLLLLLAVPATALAAREAPSASTGTVTRVVDGDTLDVRLTGGRTERVRLIGVDTPELGACWAGEATARARLLAQGKAVSLRGDSTQDARDRYGRLLAYVGLPQARDLGRELVAGGFARVYVYDRPFARLGAYRAAEGAGKRAARSLWKCGVAARAKPTAARCDPSYPDFCIPSSPPDLDCADIGRSFTVRGADPHRFDREGDGVGCESYG
jgi:micrococcal nuclease